MSLLSENLDVSVNFEDLVDLRTCEWDEDYFRDDITDEQYGRKCLDVITPAFYYELKCHLEAAHNDWDYINLFSDMFYDVFKSVLTEPGHTACNVRYSHDQHWVQMTIDEEYTAHIIYQLVFYV
jgi:hypothetical protein